MFAPSTSPTLIESQNLSMAMAGCGYVLTAPATEITAPVETPFLYISVPATSKYCWASFTRKFMALSGSGVALFTHYWNPTVAAVGALLPPVNLRNAARTLPASALVYLSPTINSGNDGVYLGSLQVNGVEEVSTLPLVVDPGRSLLITVAPGKAKDVVMAALCWFEIFP